jgi:hypothetical protein
MIRARVNDLLILGLSDENMRRLAAGEPIAFSLDMLGMQGRIIIFNGRTEESMAVQMQEFIGPSTVFMDKEKGNGH